MLTDIRADKDQANDGLSSALLILYLDSARNLPVGHAVVTAWQLVAGLQTLPGDHSFVHRSVTCSCLAVSSFHFQHKRAAMGSGPLAVASGVHCTCMRLTGFIHAFQDYLYPGVFYEGISST